MIRRSSILQGIAVAGVVALGLTACSSSDDSTESSSAPTQDSSPADGVLKIGTVLPQTGSLSALGPPEFAGIEVAKQEINGAGGVGGKDIEVFIGDSGDTSTNIASVTADQMIARGSDVILGAASSSVTLSIIDKITGSGVLQISPANTSPELSNYADNGLFFRTAPPDTFQGQVLAETVAAANVSNPAVLVLQDSYGEGLAAAFSSNFTQAGGALAAEPVFYDPKAATFDAEVGQIKSANPDGIVLIGFEESTKVIQEMIKQGIGPQDKQLFLVDGNLGLDYSALPPGTLKGTLGTQPGAEVAQTFQNRMLEVDPALQSFPYGPEAYDAVMLSALGAIAAGGETGADISSELVSITNGSVDCDTFQSCKKLLKKDKSIHYNGQSGPISFQENGDPGEATMGVYVFEEDNTFISERFVEGNVPSSVE